MSDPAFDVLARRLAQSPDNVTLRLAVVRRAVDLGYDSRALELVLDLSPDAVPGDDDRAVVAGVYAAAGLADDAKIWAHPNDAGAVASHTTEPTIPAALETDVETSENDEAVAIAQNVVPLRLVADPTESEPASETITFADVGGLSDVKREIERRIIAPFKQSGLLTRFRKRSGGGVLMYGPPGCGKTMLARATAGECGARFQAVAISDILDPLWGMAEKRLSAIFESARNSAPTILFFDEIDALGAKRTGHVASHVAQMVSHFLAEMDGVKQRNDGVLILAATNIPWSLDSAFLRPGRFDRLFFVPPPDAPARQAILELEMAERPAENGLQFDKVVRATSGYSGADLAQIVDVATDAAIDASLEGGREVPISQAMLDAAARRSRTSTTDWLTTARNHATYANESGRYDEVLAFLQKHGRG